MTSTSPFHWWALLMEGSRSINKTWVVTSENLTFKFFYWELLIQSSKNLNNLYLPFDNLLMHAWLQWQLMYTSANGHKSTRVQLLPEREVDMWIRPTFKNCYSWSSHTSMVFLWKHVVDKSNYVCWLVS